MYPSLPILNNIGGSSAPQTTYDVETQVQQALPKVVFSLPVVTVGAPYPIAAPMDVGVSNFGIGLPAAGTSVARSQDQNFGTQSLPIVGGNQTEIGRTASNVPIGVTTPAPTPPSSGDQAVGAPAGASGGQASGSAQSGGSNTPSTGSGAPPSAVQPPGSPGSQGSGAGQSSGPDQPGGSNPASTGTGSSSGTGQTSGGNPSPGSNQPQGSAPSTTGNSADQDQGTTSAPGTDELKDGKGKKKVSRSTRNNKPTKTHNETSS
ncbi:MAG: hypothetical protein JO370_11675 [Paucibacter sp.]|nr:hypothetical protein [Roseateles sp.]